MRKVYLVGLAPEKERNVAAFDDRDFVLPEEPLDRSFIDGPACWSWLMARRSSPDPADQYC